MAKHMNLTGKTLYDEETYRCPVCGGYESNWQDGDDTGDTRSDSYWCGKCGSRYTVRYKYVDTIIDEDAR